MTSRTDFSDSEWALVLQGPTGAAMYVVAAQRGGAFDEALSMAQSYSDEKNRQGASELVSAIVAAKPVVPQTRFRSTDELSQTCLAHLRCGLEIVAARATFDELDHYKRFILSLCERVAQAHREEFRSAPVSTAEHAALAQIRRELDLN
jgi:hypothetical protein